MNWLPQDVQALIKAKVGSSRLRDDLAIIPEAEAAGWVVKFPDDHWHNSATFTRGAEVVWSTSTGWTRAHLDRNKRYIEHAVFADTQVALRLTEEPLIEGMRNDGLELV